MKKITVKNNAKILVTAIFAIFVIYIGVQLFVPSDIGSIGSPQVEVQIPEGTTLKQALSILKQQNLIRDRMLFIVIGKITGLDRKIRAGYYSFLGKMSPFQVFKRLVSGKIIEYEITIVEGDTLLEIGRKLAAYKIGSVDDFNDLVKDQAFLSQLGIDAPSLEGYLFPQTYKVPKGASLKAVVRMMVSTLRESYTAKMKDRAKKMGWSEREVLTMASIIEKEAIVDEERPIISAVYHNRIKKRMPLQADPTAIYGVKSSKEKITINDLKRKTDYNTYVIQGLPPGPIASPGLKSIIAALYPANVPYLYFVSQGNGTHYFSRDWKEHAEAVKRFRAIQAAAAQSGANIFAAPAVAQNEKK
ncbi:MAG: endolytic transglycosylase MltG [Nitrospirota bacterium]